MRKCRIGFYPEYKSYGMFSVNHNFWEFDNDIFWKSFKPTRP